MNFFKDSKIVKACRALVQYVVFEIFTSAHHTNLQERSFYYLMIIYMKNITESQDKQNIESVHALFVICTCVT